MQPIVLPEPQKDGGKSVLASLQQRKTGPRISPKPLPLLPPPAERLGPLLFCVARQPAKRRGNLDLARAFDRAAVVAAPCAAG